MKKTLSLSFWLLIVCGMTNAQNVGVGTTTPTEKLDVNGNVNVNGQLKLNGNAGTANQVMLKDANNNPVWGDLSSYQNIAVFDCNNTATTTVGNFNCTQPWTVPAGVTTILVECWGGGGGGGGATGGGGGGYITAKINVVAGSVANLTTGAGGVNSNGVQNGIDGGTTSLNIGAITLNANGGFGGRFQNPTAAQGIQVPLGGNFLATGLSNSYFGLVGHAGNLSVVSYAQIGTSSYITMIKYGDGGDAGNMPNSGGNGGYSASGTGNAISHSIYAQVFASLPGGGGGADVGNGYYGRGGRIIIRW
jgi:hypothetical protein